MTHGMIAWSTSLMAVSMAGTIQDGKLGGHRRSPKHTGMRMPSRLKSLMSIVAMAGGCAGGTACAAPGDRRHRIGVSSRPAHAGIAAPDNSATNSFATSS
jgi:hypothetical protein